MKIILTESQYKKVLIREFGETENNPKEWYHRILNWVGGDRSRLQFDSNQYEVVVHDNKGIYFDPYNPNSISNSFEKVLLKGSNYESYSEYLLKKSKSYSWSLTFEKTYNYFNQLKKNETDYSES